MNIFKKIGVLCLPCFLLACQITPAPVSEPPLIVGETKNETGKNQVKESPVDNAVKAPAAVLSLLARAQQQEDKAAIVSLERAIRIAPRYPESYFRLGELRYAQGEYAQARSLAQKALSLGATGKLLTQAQSLVQRSSAAL